jgi:ATP-dependent helicase HrpB
MLPVLQIADQIVERLSRANRLVLTAPTGSGKTTQVAQIVHRAGIVAGDQQVIVLQPRRLATRLVASRVAREMNVPLGGLVGYQTRHDSAASAATRIRFMTEGLLLRMLQSDPSLRGIGCVILDEFHERNLPADISLGLVKRLQERPPGPRGDLKLMVMSATLDATMVAGYLTCESISAGGRLHPVEVRFLPKPPGLRQPVWELAAEALRSVIDSSSEGDVLVFMPGVYEINRTIEACERKCGPMADPPLRLMPLHGSLTPAQQDAAVDPLPAGAGRKVVVATNVAETSLTIEGVRYVIDSGLARIHRFDAQRGLNALRIEPISKASADQRAGRAGRTAPGVCLRLWTSRDHGTRADHDEPEVQRLELSEAALTLKSMGVIDLEQFDWLQRPDAAAVRRAEALLHDLGAIAPDGSLTQAGRLMADFPCHPRQARVMLDAARRGCLKRATLWAALIGERDILQQARHGVLPRFIEKDEPASDLAVRERIVEELRRSTFSQRHADELGVNAAACRDVDRAAQQFLGICRRLQLPGSGPDRTDDLIKCVLTAFRDHLAMKIERDRPNCAMVGRRKVLLDRESVLSGRDAGLFVALDVREIGTGDKAQTMLSLASHVATAWLEEADAAGFATRHQLEWNHAAKAVEAIEQRTYRGLTLQQTSRPPTSPSDLDAAATMIVGRIITGELTLDHWNDKVEQWITRARSMARWFPERGLIAYDDDDIRVILHEIVGKSSRFSQVRDKPCLDFVRGALSWDDQQFIERMAPESIPLPRGWRMKVEYAMDGPPKARVKIQDLYDLDDTPRIAAGRQPVLLEILGPNFRPVQVTSDLRGFWQNLYPELKKELKRRYPRHEWR